MLVLSRKVGQTVVIGGQIVVTVTALRGRYVSLGITAPAEVPIRRDELGPKDGTTQQGTAAPTDSGRQGGARVSPDLP